MKTIAANFKKTILLSILFAAPISFSTTSFAKDSFLQRVSTQSHARQTKRFCSQGVMCGKICVSERYVCHAHQIPKSWPKPKSSLKTKVARN